MTKNITNKTPLFSPTHTKKYQLNGPPDEVCQDDDQPVHGGHEDEDY